MNNSKYTDTFESVTDRNKRILKKLENKSKNERLESAFVYAVMIEYCRKNKKRENQK